MNDGGAAFPVPSDCPYTRFAGDYGMTLRDWFAGQALTGVLGNPATMEFMATKGDDLCTTASRLSYEMADAMIAERDKGKK